MTEISTAPDLPLGKIIDKMLELRDERKRFDDQSKQLKKEYDELEIALIDRLDNEETIQGKSKHATATITELIVPQIEDWESFERYILDNNALYMMERRPAGAIFRELQGQGETIPGIKPFTKRSISLRRQ